MNSNTCFLRTMKAYLIAMKAEKIHLDYDKNLLTYEIGSAAYTIELKREFVQKDIPRREFLSVFKR